MRRAASTEVTAIHPPPISIYSPHPKELIFVKLHPALQAAPNSARHAAFAHLPRRIVPLTHNRRYFRVLVQSGLNLETLKPADLAPADEFHLAGLISTQELAAQMESRPTLGRLDIGSALGGPALLDKMPQMGRNTLAI